MRDVLAKVKTVGAIDFLAYSAGVMAIGEVMIQMGRYNACKTMLLRSG